MFPVVHAETLVSLAYGIKVMLDGSGWKQADLQTHI